MEMADQGMDEVLDPVFFIKLIPDTKRSKADVDSLKDKWSKELLVEFSPLPALHLKLVTVDRATISLQTKSRIADELREWMLQQEGVHEVLQDEKVFRKPGLRPLQQLRAYLAKELRRAQRSRIVETFKRKRGKGKGTRGLGRGKGSRPAGWIGQGKGGGGQEEL